MKNTKNKKIVYECNEKATVSRLGLKFSNTIVFTSFSKRNFYLREYVTAFVLNHNNTPISPFMNFDYNLSNIVNKDLIRIANNTLIRRAQEVWVFGEISDGVLIEVYLAKKYKIPVKYFKPINEGLSFEEIDEKDVLFENVSSWMWDWVKTNKNLERWHPRLRFKKEYKIVYPAYSKRNFFWQMHISKFCLENKRIPLNPFMLFRYFLSDAVKRQTVYDANSKIVELCDEVWVFGEVSDGVLAEIKQKKSQGSKIKYFKLSKSDPFVFRKIPVSLVMFENKELEKFRGLL